MRNDNQPGGLASVIVPIFNVERYLSNCVESILAQSYGSFEIILVDDGSTDGSSQIADMFALRDRRVAVIHQANAGASAARNAGLAIARGTWVTFVDADDWLHPEFLGWMVSCAIGRSESMNRVAADVVVSTAVLTTFGDRGPVPQCWNVDASDATAALLLPGIAVGSWNKLYRRTFLEDQGITFNTAFTMGEGLMFVTDVSQRAKLCVFTNRGLYYYRRDNRDSATSRLTPTKMANALAAIRAIRDRLVLRTPLVIDALDFHAWRTLFLATAAECLAGTGDRSALYNDAIRALRRQGPRMLRVRGLTFRERIRSIPITVMPRISATLLARRWARR
jgi:glycosyltransferase involved in cell wall biosynthesis